MSDEGGPRESPASPARRRFVTWIGLGGVFGLFAGALGPLAAGDARGQGRAKAAPPSAAPPPPPPPPPSDEAKALHSILTGRYGEHLDAAQKESLLGALENTVQSGKALRAKKLANAIEPDVVFAARAPLRDRRGEAGR